MNIGELIFLIFVIIHGACFLTGLALVIVHVVRVLRDDDFINKSDVLYYVASALWAIGPVFSIAGAFVNAFV